MATIETLKPGQSLISGIRKVANGKVQIELVSFVNKGSVNVTALFNQSDERFAQNKPRRAWKSGEVVDIAGSLGLSDDMIAKLKALAEGETIVVNLLNPSIADNSSKKHQLFVLVKEYTESELLARRSIKEDLNQSTKSIDYMLENSEKTAKKNPSTGEFITVGGEMVFAETDFSAGAPEHKFVVAAEAVAVADAAPFTEAPSTI